MGREEKTYAQKLTISEVASENAQILAFKFKKLAIARSHKQSRKLIHPREVRRVGAVTVRLAISLIKPAISLIWPPVSVVSPAIHVVRPAVSLVRPAVSLIRPPVSVVSPAIHVVMPAIHIVRPAKQINYHFMHCSIRIKTHGLKIMHNYGMYFPQFCCPCTCPIESKQ